MKLKRKINNDSIYKQWFEEKNDPLFFTSHLSIISRSNLPE